MSYVTHPTAAVHAGETGDYVPTLLRYAVSIGAHAKGVCGVTIGEWAFAAASAVVTTDVPPYALMPDVPARRLRWAALPA